MSVKTKIILLTVACAIPAFLLGRVIWPDPMDAPQLAGIQIAGFMLIAALEALAFGAGVSFICFGRKLLRNAPSARARHARLAFSAIAWTLVSWWPHDNMHRANGMMNAWGLLRIEYIFHLTLIISAFIIASYFIRTLRAREE